MTAPTSELLGQLIGRLDRLSETNFQHPELGINGFADAHEIKRSLVEYLRGVFQLTSAAESRLHAGQLQRRLEIISANLVGVENAGQKIDVLAGQVNLPQFPQRRVDITTEVENHRRAVEDLAGELETYALAHLGRMALDDSALAARTREVDELKNDVGVLKQDAVSLVRALREAGDTESKKAATAAFSGRRDAHRDREARWFVAFVLSLGGVAASIWYVAIHQLSPTTDSDPAAVVTLVSDIVRRLIVLSAAGVLAKVCLAKYNLERNLRIIYDHRVSVLEQFGVFESTIEKDDKDTRNRFRLELAKYIFTDPQTGYLGEQAADLNLSPVVQVGESLLSKSVK